MTPQLPTRQLAQNGPQVTALGYGAMSLSRMQQFLVDCLPF